eukprot:6028061-Pleurochrysis_carterae.AAC.10
MQPVGRQVIAHVLDHASTVGVAVDTNYSSAKHRIRQHPSPRPCTLISSHVKSMFLAPSKAAGQMSLDSRSHI